MVLNLKIVYKYETYYRPFCLFLKLLANLGTKEKIHIKKPKIFKERKHSAKKRLCFWLAR